MTCDISEYYDMLDECNQPALFCEIHECDADNLEVCQDGGQL